MGFLYFILGVMVGGILGGIILCLFINNKLWIGKTFIVHYFIIDSKHFCEFSLIYWQIDIKDTGCYNLNKIWR